MKSFWIFVGWFVGVSVAIALFCIFAFLFSALAIGTANAWVLKAPFGEAWDKAWASPIITCLWGFLFFTILLKNFSIKIRFGTD